MSAREALSLTHVEFAHGDKLGLFMAVLSLLPFLLIGATLGAIVLLRNVEHVLFFVAILANELANSVLKRSLRVPRPSCSPRSDSFGMPSDHAQFMFFAAGYIWLQHRPSARSAALVTTACGLFGAAVAVAVSRVYLCYHTTSQVVAGAVVGLALVPIWRSRFVRGAVLNVLCALLEHGPLRSIWLLASVRDGTFGSGERLAKDA